MNCVEISSTANYSLDTFMISFTPGTGSEAKEETETGESQQYVETGRVYETRRLLQKRAILRAKLSITLDHPLQRA